MPLIPENELNFTFIHADGPGGQNVNKVSSAVELRFDVASSPSLPEDVKERLEKLAGKRITREGILIIQAKRFREQEKNREDAISRFQNLVEKALNPPRFRKKTLPTKASQERRLLQKKHKSEIKRMRRKKAIYDE